MSTLAGLKLAAERIVKLDGKADGAARPAPEKRSPRARVAVEHRRLRWKFERDAERARRSAS